MPKRKEQPVTYPDWETAAQAAVDSCPRSTGSSHAHLVNIENWLKEARDYIASDISGIDAMRNAVDPGSQAFAQAANLFRSIVDDALEGVPGIIPSEQIRAEREANLLKTLAAKQHDYGHDNILWAGVDGVIVRMHDKIARIKNIMARTNAVSSLAMMDRVTPRNESIYDSWLDIAGYGVIALMLLEGTFTLDLRADIERPVPNDLASTTAANAQVIASVFETTSSFIDGNRILEELSLPLDEYVPPSRDGFEDVEPPDEEAYDFELDDPGLWHYQLEHQHIIVGIYDKGYGDGRPRAFVGVRGLGDKWSRCAYFTHDQLNDLLAYLDDTCDYLRHVERATALRKDLVVADVG